MFLLDAIPAWTTFFASADSFDLFGLVVFDDEVYELGTVGVGG
jgi:hypothetical protein